MARDSWHKAYGHSRGRGKVHRFGQESSISIISNITLAILLEERNVGIREKEVL